MSRPLPRPSRPPDPGGDDFDALLADAQPRIRGYILSILGGWPDVEDILQETNLVILRKRDSFEPGTSFIAWAFRIAYFKATTWRRDRMREGRVVISDAFFQELAEAAERRFEENGPLTEALAGCLEQLAPDERDLVQVKYVQRRSLVEHAAICGASVTALHKKISRIRLALRHCIRKRFPDREAPFHPHDDEPA